MKIQITDDVSVCVDDDIASMTSWVLLEQEDWFEDEIKFLRRICEQGWQSLDVGANHGLYALALARRGSRVWAFEPATLPFRRLRQSVDENGFTERVVPVSIGLSDRARQAELAVSANSELNTLQTNGRIGTTETVTLESLDIVCGTIVPDGTRIDFLKLDAEGEEEAIIRGGQRFFREQDPLVMFEVKHGKRVNTGLLSSFQSLGYDIYRLVPGLDVLVPLASPVGEGKLDPFTLNLFACKAGRATQLASQGHLVAINGEAIEAPPAETEWIRELLRLPALAERLPQTWQKASFPRSYGYPLLAWCGSRIHSIPAAKRLALLSVASTMLESKGDGSAARQLLVRVLADLGDRARAVAVARELQRQLPAGKMALDLPVPPVLKSFETQLVRQAVGPWLRASLDEFVQRAQSFSGYFSTGNLDHARSLLANPEHSVEAERRCVLAGRRAKAGLAISPTSHLYRNAANNRNAALWRKLTSTWGYSSGSRSLARWLGGQPIRVVDVGASTHGYGTEPYATLIEAEMAQITGFEPDSAACEKLNTLYGDQGYRYIPAFVGKGGAATFHDTTWFMTGSLYPPNSELCARYQQLGEVTALKGQRAITTVTLDETLAGETVDFIKIDVQGAELDVFLGAETLLPNVLAIWTEVEFVELYRGQPLFSEIEQFLRSRGFTFLKFNGIATRALKPLSLRERRLAGTQAIWSDACFVRAPQHWDDLSDDQLRRLAILTHDVLSAPDWTFAILSTLDRRNGSGLSREYHRRFLSEEWTLQTSPDQ